MPLRWRDYDWIGHVNHINYLDLVLEALGTSRGRGGSCSCLGVSMEFVAPRTVRPEHVVIDQVARDEAGAGATFAISTEHRSEPQLHARVTLRTAKEATRDVSAPHRYAVTLRQRDVLDGPTIDVTFLDWLQESRGDLLRDLFLGAEGSSVAVVHLEYDRCGLRPMRDLDFVVSTGITAIGRSSFRVHSQLEAAGSMLASATVVMVKISLESGRAVALTERDRALLQGWRNGKSTLAGQSHKDQA